MSIAAVIANIQQKVAAIDGIKAAPLYPPATLDKIPISVCYLHSGETKFQSAGWCTIIQTIICEIHATNLDLPKDTANALPFIDAFIKALMADPQLGNTVNTVLGVSYVFGNLKYGNNEPHVGITFRISVNMTLTN